MQRYKPFVIGACGLICIGAGNPGGILLIVWAALLGLPRRWVNPLYRSGEPWPPRVKPREPGNVLAPLPRRTRIWVWAATVVLVCALIISLGTIAVYIAGYGAFAALVASAIVGTMSVQALFRIEPRTAASDCAIDTLDQLLRSPVCESAAGAPLRCRRDFAAGGSAGLPTARR
jgi:hypothetical protein